MKAAVIGSGAAGLFASLELKEAGFDVVLITEKIDGGSTPRARGGIAIPLDDGDVENHIMDTLAVGDGLADPAVVRRYIGLGPILLQRLMALGLRPTARVREGGHSRARVVSVGGDATGEALWRTLYEAALRKVEIVESRAAGLTEDNGVELADGDVVKADIVVVATGGYAGRYKFSSTRSRGDFLMALFKVGAILRDLEFVQFHPTGTPDGELISEAVRGAGAVLINGDGERFMYRYDPRGELAPRGVVSRAVYVEIARTSAVYLDTSAVEVEKFAFLPKIVAKWGRRIPVMPLAHYSIGGAAVDALGRSNIKGLFAIGEASNSGFHGADRLPSNSLLEALAQGHLVAKAARAYLTSGVWEGPVCDAVEKYEGPVVEGYAGDVLWEKVGVVRSEEKLKQAGEELREVDTLSYLIARAALWRAESRGVHWREDKPQRDDRYKIRLCFRRG